MRANKKMSKQPEYDVQKIVADFLEDWLRNTEFIVRREREGKVDVVIFRDEEPEIFYEMKTYFKASENIDQAGIFSDVEKLAGKLTSVTQKAYMLIAGAKNKLEEELPEFIKSHNDNRRSWYYVDPQELISMRPSRKDISSGHTFVMSWEVSVKSE
jgi:hypothetical protein